MADDLAAHRAERDLEPSGGLTSISRAAPESDMSMIAALIFAAVGQRMIAHRIGRRDALVAAVLGQVELVPVGEPGELGRELVLLAQRSR